jgi:hypothetical protein
MDVSGNIGHGYIQCALPVWAGMLLGCGARNCSPTKAARRVGPAAAVTPPEPSRQGAHRARRGKYRQLKEGAVGRSTRAVLSISSLSSDDRLYVQMRFRRHIGNCLLATYFIMGSSTATLATLAVRACVGNYSAYSVLACLGNLRVTRALHWFGDHATTALFRFCRDRGGRAARPRSPCSASYGALRAVALLSGIEALVLLVAVVERIPL